MFCDRGLDQRPVQRHATGSVLEHDGHAVAGTDDMQRVVPDVDHLPRSGMGALEPVLLDLPGECRDHH
jgi:hypothetical protein